MIPIVIILSFILDSIVSNFTTSNSLFFPLFTLLSLIIIYPYFNGNKTKYFITGFITGMFYDIIYTDTIIIHAFLFFFIAFIITKLNLILSNNYFNVIIMALVCIVFYRVASYGLLLLTGNISFDLDKIFKSIYSSIILNVVYICILYIITDKISKKFKIRKSN